MYQPVLSSACLCLCEHVMEKRSRYFCLKQKNKQAKHTASYWAKGNIFGFPVCECVYMCICICIYMCVCICIYTESEWEYLCISLINLTGAKSLLKNIKSLYSETPISQTRVYLEYVCSCKGTQIWKLSELPLSCCRGTAPVRGWINAQYSFELTEVFDKCN